MATACCKRGFQQLQLLVARGVPAADAATSKSGQEISSSSNCWCCVQKWAGNKVLAAVAATCLRGGVKADAA